MVQSVLSPMMPLENEVALMENHKSGPKLKMTSAISCRAHVGDMKPCQLILETVLV